jgi:hypothetical protein
MAFMNIYLTQKGALYSADCSRCGCTMYVHEWGTDDNNGDRDALQDGTLRCSQCGVGRADPATFVAHGRKYYAGRYSANGYMDCTDWHYGTNKRQLVRELRDMYGSAE